MIEKEREEFIRDITSKVNDMPIIGLVFINKVVSEELLKRCMDMADEVFKREK